MVMGGLGKFERAIPEAHYAGRLDGPAPYSVKPEIPEQHELQ